MMHVFNSTQDGLLVIHTCNGPNSNAQNLLDTFQRNFPVDGEVANLLWTC